MIEAENISIAYDGRKMVHDFSCRLMRGDRIGLVGPNGIGKSTLIKALLQEIELDSGTVKHGTKLKVAYFDQHRDALDLEKTRHPRGGGSNDAFFILPIFHQMSFGGDSGRAKWAIYLDPRLARQQ